MSFDIEQRINEIDRKLDLLLSFIGSKDENWQICDKPLVRIEFEYWPNDQLDGPLDTPGFRLKLQKSGHKKVDTYKQLYGKPISQYDIACYQDLPINTHIDFSWLNREISVLTRSHKQHHIVFFHQLYVNCEGMEEVFNNFLLVVDQNTLSGFVLLRCINDKPIKVDLEFQPKEVNSKTRYMCALSANQLKPVRRKIK